MAELAEPTGHAWLDRVLNAHVEPGWLPRQCMPVLEVLPAQASLQPAGNQLERLTDVHGTLTLPNMPLSWLPAQAHSFLAGGISWTASIVGPAAAIVHGQYAASIQAGGNGP